MIAVAAAIAPRRSVSPDPTLRVIVTRAADQAEETAAALAAAGIHSAIVPAISIEPTPPGGPLDRALSGPRHDWIVITSPNGARAVLTAAERLSEHGVVPPWHRGARLAVVGPGTGQVLEAAGLAVGSEPSVPRAEALARELPLNEGDRVLLVRGDLADAALPRLVRARGARVHPVTAYRTLLAPDASVSALVTALNAGPVSAFVFTSGSTVTGTLLLAQRAERLDILSSPAIAVGRGAAIAAGRAGFTVHRGIEQGPDQWVRLARVIHDLDQVESAC